MGKNRPHTALLPAPPPGRICSAPPPLLLRFYRSGGEAEVERSKTVEISTLAIARQQAFL